MQRSRKWYAFCSFACKASRCNWNLGVCQGFRAERLSCCMLVCWYVKEGVSKLIRFSQMTVCFQKRNVGEVKNVKVPRSLSETLNILPCEKNVATKSWWYQKKKKWKGASDVYVFLARSLERRDPTQGGYVVERQGTDCSYSVETTHSGCDQESSRKTFIPTWKISRQEPCRRGSLCPSSIAGSHFHWEVVRF
jgi:hypothetical protein